MKPNSGRLVWNHSTHLEGIIPILEKLTQVEGIRTITPAVIGRAKSNSPQLKLKVSVPIRGGFKLIARKGKSFQEVFIVTELSQEELEKAIAQILSGKSVASLSRKNSEIDQSPVNSSSAATQKNELDRRAFMKLSLEERRKLLKQQAEQLDQHYRDDLEWRELETGDLVEY